MVLIKVEDLKNNYSFIATFEAADDMILFLNKYNPLSIHVEIMECSND